MATAPFVPVAIAELPIATELLSAVLLLPNATEPVPNAELALPSATAPGPFDVLFAPIASAPVPVALFGSPIATAPSPFAVWPRPIATAPPAAVPLLAVVPLEPIATFWPVAPDTTPSPCAMP